MKVCSVQDCGKRVLAFGWCSTHYSRMRRHGTLEILPEVKQAGIEKMRASKIGKPGHWRGKKRGPHTKEWNEKIRRAHKGKPNSPKHNANIALARTGTKRSPETVEKVRQWKLAHPRKMPEAEKKKLRERWLGKKNPRFTQERLGNSRGKWTEYAGTMFRSTWEARFAKALDARGLRWEYEPKRFDLGTRTYLPDFYVPDTGAYWEVKGWFTEESQDTVALFREQFPETPLIVATGEILRMMEV